MRNILMAFVFVLFAASAVRAEGLGEGEALFEARCALCHQLPDPAQLKAEQWKKVMSVMQKRMEQKGMPPLPEDEMELISAYLSQNARK